MRIRQMANSKSPSFAMSSSERALLWCRHMASASHNKFWLWIRNDVGPVNVRHQRNNQRFIESTSDQESISEAMMKTYARAHPLKYQLGFYCRFFDSALIRRRSMKTKNNKFHFYSWAASAACRIWNDNKLLKWPRNSVASVQTTELFK